MASQIIEVQVQSFQLLPASLGKWRDRICFKPIVTKRQFSELTEASICQSLYAFFPYLITTKAQEQNTVPVSLTKLKHLLIPNLTQIQLDKLDIVAGPEQLAHFLEGLHVDDIEF